jgi:uncharacterized protein
MPADTVWRGTVVALVVFVLLASGDMVRSAEGMPLGWQRSLTVGVTRVVDRVSNLLSLNRPYDWAADKLGLEQPDKDFTFSTDDTLVTSEVVPEAPTTTSTLPPVRQPSAESPLRVVVAGDSTAKALGEALKAAAADNPELQVAIEGKVSTGLARFDYFNWGARMSQIVDADDPEVVLFMVGANDGQSILEGDGTILAQFGRPNWPDEYRRRIAGIMDLNRGGARRLIWVGEPNVGTGNVQQAIRIGNELAREEAEKRSWVSFFDVATLVAGPDGGFSEFVTLPDGSTARCYAGDAVHLSVRCLNTVIDQLLPEVTGLYSTGSGGTVGAGGTVDPTTGTGGPSGAGAAGSSGSGVSRTGS